LELERLKINPRTNTITSDDPNLSADYHNVVGWLRGFFSGWNFNPGTDGDVTKGATNYQMMTWIFSYCRTHPSETLGDAVFEFIDAASKGSKR
jgi:hypothetical protein